MKTPGVEPITARAVPIHWPLWTSFTVLFVALILLFSFVNPVNAATTVRVGSTTASYGCAGRTHTVRSGETLYSIAARYGSTAYRIASCNGLRSYTVRVGQRLQVPVYRKGTSGSGWIEGIDFARDANAPESAIVTAGSTR